VIKPLPCIARAFEQSASTSFEFFVPVEGNVNTLRMRIEDHRGEDREDRMQGSAVTDIETPTPASPARPPRPPRAEAPKTTWVDRVEAFISRLSTRDNFWHAICSFIWLPLAFFSGIRTRQIDADSYAAYLPFPRFNRNWYRAMAGGALLGNAEIAGGCTCSAFAAASTPSSARTSTTPSCGRA
jgi:hypothetical protein